MARKQVISAERLVVGDVITAWVGQTGQRHPLAQPRKVTAISPEFPGAQRTLAIGSTTKTGRYPGMRVTDRDEQVEIEVKR